MGANGKAVSGCFAIENIFYTYFPAGWDYVDGYQIGAEWEFLARKEDGTLVMLLGVYEDQEWKWTESSPLPEGTTIGDNNITDAVNLGNEDYYGKYTIGVHYTAMGQWELYYLNSYDVMLYAEGIDSPDFGEYGSVVFGDSPWKDIRSIDWQTLPSNDETSFNRMPTEEIRSILAGFLSREGWATVHQSDENPIDMYAMPGKGNEKIGAFYGGAPLHVLEMQGEWVYVRAGAQVDGGITGWIHSENLLFGDDILSEPSRLITDREWAHPVITVHGAFQELIPGDAFASEWMIIGGSADLNIPIIVYNYRSGDIGCVSENDIWAGNG